jgi:hypothetical protein
MHRRFVIILHHSLPWQKKLLCEFNKIYRYQETFENLIKNFELKSYFTILFNLQCVIPFLTTIYPDLNIPYILSHCKNNNFEEFSLYFNISQAWR